MKLRQKDETNGETCSGNKFLPHFRLLLLPTNRARFIIFSIFTKNRRVKFQLDHVKVGT